MAMGPNAVGDLAGLDIGYQARREWPDKPDDPALLPRVGPARGTRPLRPEDRPRLLSLRRAGRRAHVRTRRCGELIRAEAERLGVQQRSVDADAEIVDRCILALVNEGARILEEGIAASAGRHRRHLVQWLWLSAAPRRPDVLCGHVGLQAVANAMRALASEHGERYWEPAPLLAELARKQSTFAAWQAARTAA